MHKPIFLGVNVDHVATLRQARGETYPDPVAAALIAERCGADSITVHLREDRRHIQDHDVMRLQASTQTRVNLEMAITDAMIAFALAVGPADCCLVPEKREELTTEGGLDVSAQPDRTREAVAELSDAGVRVSLFIDPDRAQIDAAAASGAPVIELHTGSYAQARGAAAAEELRRISDAAGYAASIGLIVNAGHGLHVHNVQPIAAVNDIVELNIGHALIAESLFDGLPAAVREMKRLMVEART